MFWIWNTKEKEAGRRLKWVLIWYTRAGRSFLLSFFLSINEYYTSLCTCKDREVFPYVTRFFWYSNCVIPSVPLKWNPKLFPPLSLFEYLTNWKEIFSGATSSMMTSPVNKGRKSVNSMVYYKPVWRGLVVTLIDSYESPVKVGNHAVRIRSQSRCQQQCFYGLYLLILDRFFFGYEFKAYEFQSIPRLVFDEFCITWLRVILETYRSMSSSVFDFISWRFGFYFVSSAANKFFLWRMSLMPKYPLCKQDCLLMYRLPCR